MKLMPDVRRAAGRGPVWAAAFGLLAGMAGWPAMALDDAAERQRIAAERQQAQERYRRDSTECAARFVVTACEDEARARRRTELERLLAQQTRLDDARRQQRAAQRQQRIEHQLEQESVRVESAASPGSASMRPPVRSRVRVAGEPAAGPVPSRTAAPRSAAAGPVDRPEDARRAQEAAQQRERQAAAHRAKIEARNAERAKRKPAAAPLPPRASAP